MNFRAPREQLRAPVRGSAPGRLLARLHPGRHQLTSLGRIKKRPEGQGKIALNDDRHRYGTVRILEVLRDACVVVDDIINVPSVPFLGTQPPEAREPGSTVIIIDAVDSLNRRLSRLTGVRVDLKTAVPVAFAGAGLWTIARGGRVFGKSSGWLLLRLAIDVFLKLNPTRR